MRNQKIKLLECAKEIIFEPNILYNTDDHIPQSSNIL